MFFWVLWEAPNETSFLGNKQYSNTGGIRGQFRRNLSDQRKFFCSYFIFSRNPTLHPSFPLMQMRIHLISSTRIIIRTFIKRTWWIKNGPCVGYKVQKVCTRNGRSRISMPNMIFSEIIKPTVWISDAS